LVKEFENITVYKNEGIEIDHEAFGRYIRHKRKEYITLRGFAKDLGVSPSYLSDVELGRRCVSKQMVLRICCALGRIIGGDVMQGILVGQFASAGSTTGTVLLDATTTYAVGIFGGLAADPGSGTNARPLRSRFMLNTGGNIEAETYGIMGQLVVKSSNLGHWHGGVLGTIECQTALNVYNPLAGVGALVGRIGGSTITVTSSCYLAGVIALASSVGVSNSGTYAGLYVTKTSGATNFSHEAYIENSDIGIELKAATDGILISGATTYAIRATGTINSGCFVYANITQTSACYGGIWMALTSSVTSGDVMGMKSVTTGTGASGTANVRAMHGQAKIGASGFADNVDGILAEVSVAAGSADTQHVACLRAHFSQGASFVNDLTFYVIHGRCQTVGTETFSGNNALLGLENQAVGGNGKKLNAIIEAKYTSLSGGVHAADYLIDGGTATDLIDTAILRLPDDGSVCHDTDTGSGTDLQFSDFTGYITVVIGTATRYIPLLTNKPSGLS